MMKYLLELIYVFELNSKRFHLFMLISFFIENVCYFKNEIGKFYLGILRLPNARKKHDGILIGLMHFL